MNNRIWLSSPHMGGNELKYIQDAFEKNWIAPLGENINGFEQDLASYSGIKGVSALSSGTAALHMALILLNVRQDDEILVSSLTFSASVNPIIYQRATPILIDSDWETWNMDPELMEKAIRERISMGKKPKAIIAVHLYGMPARIDKILEIAGKYEIPVIEDAAEALGSRYKNRPLGTFGLMGVYSFNGNKIITTSGGGALISDDEELIKRSTFLATQARDKAVHFEHSEVGYNYRISNVIAGIGRGQMEVLDERIKLRRENHQFYKELLSSYPGITLLEEPDADYYSNHWLTCIHIDPGVANGITREHFRLSLEKNNIESRPLWKPMHQQPVFQHYPFYSNGISDELFENGLCLPSGSNLTNEDKNCIAEAIKEVLKS